MNEKRSRLTKVGKKDVADVDYVVQAVSVALLGSQYRFLQEKANEMSVYAGERICVSHVLRALVQKEMDLANRRGILNE